MRFEQRSCIATLALIGSLTMASGCDWQGPNSLPLPGTEGGGAGAYAVKIQMPNVMSIQRNSRVRVNDVTVGNVADVQLEGWHALVTVRLDRDVHLPANATAKIGQTSLLGSLHIELAAPLNEPASGELKDGSVIPMEHASTYPTTEQTLASLSTVLNGGGLAQIQEISTQANASLSGHESEIRDLLTRTDTFSASLNGQRDDILTAAEGLDRLAATVGQQNDVLAGALDRIPPALVILQEQRQRLTDTLLSLGGFADSANRVVTASSADLQQNLRDIEPAMRALADAGPDLPNALGLLPTYPWPLANIPKFFRGDAGNLSGTVDLTLGRLDRGLLQGTALEGLLTNAETALGRTVDRVPALSTKNPLTAGLDSVAIRGGK
ncbi:MCE family protein [Nocardia sp. NBC_00565]|uniref:MCE family protein n=1 Tax=Nocardia sp. NBC_00565 TaxID=2975993 RepID=UPI002E801CE1|nr:MCE family protein [Nocardia sp. NBC_00565]WUC06695.1 MCE family protein [Nocardia sp. NBC_00565]